MEPSGIVEMVVALQWLTKTTPDTVHTKSSWTANPNPTRILRHRMSCRSISMDRENRGNILHQFLPRQLPSQVCYLHIDGFRPDLMQ